MLPTHIDLVDVLARYSCIDSVVCAGVSLNFSNSVRQCLVTLPPPLWIKEYNGRATVWNGTAELNGIMLML